jgi:DNA-binding response OmpR family regulator/HPt (histidine-containing phosphotransfer) domain-containing protein
MHKILIIEDDAIVAHIYRSRLEKEGYEVEICNDGQSGFYRIHEFRPDAVLLDLMLPKMNGVDILKKIRAQAQFARTPIIVFTNVYVPNMIHEAFGAGATQVFSKATLTPRQIIEALHSAVHSYNGNAAPPLTASTDEGSGEAPEATGESPYHSGDSASSSGASTASTAVLAAPRTEVAEARRWDDAKEEEFQSELFTSFQRTASDTLAGLRKALQEFTKAADDATRLPPLLELYRKVHALTGGAGIAGLHNVSQMAAALEVLLKELYEKPKNINASTLRTVAHSIDFIAELFSKGVERDSLSKKEINILVVDDEILSRRAITYALEKAGLKATSIEESQAALTAATENTYDLIFLDVRMPGMDGFELCTKIRGVEANKTTPVIFVTSLTDFKSRARSSLSGGTDLIAKPFMFIELSVKALTYVLRGRLARK